MNWDNSSPTIINCILWNNTAGIEGDEMFNNGMPSIRYTDIQGGIAGIVNDGDGSVVDDGGNIDADPLFVSAVDLRLQKGASPCIDAGDNTAPLSDNADLDGDGDNMEILPFDFGKVARFTDDTGTADTGNGTAPIIDMGAHEVQ